MEATNDTKDITTFTTAELIEHYEMKRSAKKFTTEAVAAGWSVTNVDKNEYSLKITVERSDVAQQREAADALNIHSLGMAKAVGEFDPEGGGYYGIRFTAEDDGYAGVFGSTFSDLCNALHVPANRILKAKENEVNAASSDRKRLAAVALTEDYLAEESGWDVKRVQDLANYEPQPITNDARHLSDTGWFLRAAKAEGVKCMTKNLAQVALRLHGQPTVWDGEVPSEPMTIEQACARAAREALSGHDRDTAAELIEAIQKIDRGY